MWRPSSAGASREMRIFSGRTDRYTGIPGARCASLKHSTPPSSAIASRRYSPSTTSLTTPSRKLVSPMNAATKLERGASYTSAGVPTCSIRPSFITAMRSDRLIDSPWSWVTNRKVMPTSSWMRSSSIAIRWRSLRSRAASGSSSSSTCGRLISARAIATRCRIPPESCSGRLSPWSSICTSASMRSTSDSISRRGRRATRSPKATFSRTDRCGNSA